MMNEPLSPARVAEALLLFAGEELEWEDFGEYINWIPSSVGRSWDVPDLGTVTIVDYHSYDQDKSYDGWSEQLWVVFDINGTLYKASGTYTSYSGSEWSDTLTIVRPVEKTYIDYEEVTNDTTE